MLRRPPISAYEGDTPTWRCDYSRQGVAPADGWSLEYRFAPRYGGAGETTVIAQPDGTGYTAQLPASLTAGDWRWRAVAIKGNETRTVDSGRIVIYGVTSDSRSQAERILEAIDAALEGRATSDTQSLAINGRRIDRIPIPELIQLRTYYAGIVARERRARRLAEGGRMPRTIKVRMP